VILVTTGTNGVAFDRLLGVVGSLDVGEELVVQHGPSQLRAPGATNVEYLPFGELEQLVRRARLVITHAGVGSILLALLNGIRPLVVPRAGALGEAVDDHQLQLARRLAELGIVELVEDPAALAAAIATADPELRASGPSGGRLAIELRAYIGAACGVGSTVDPAPTAAG
jgi:UDP-N-acetylglucosamine transferase subunit ALG13